MRNHRGSTQLIYSSPYLGEEVMDEEVFNLEVRKFLKRFGVTAQREIEKAVDAALQRRALTGNEVLQVHAKLSIPGVLPELQIDGEIALSGRAQPGAR
jgi:hypothetical protein